MIHVLMWQQYKTIKTNTLTLREDNSFFVLDLFIPFGVTCWNLSQDELSQM